MPIHLPPVSRRHFLRQVALAGAGFLTLRHLEAAEAGVDADHFALFSDTHIAADPSQIARNVNMAEHLRQAVKEVVALKTRPAGVFVNGDCALDRGLAEDYTTFTTLLQPLREAGMPLHLGLGNHDDREKFWDSLKGVKAGSPPVIGKHILVVKAALANWFLLDSLDVTKSTPGKLGEEQRAWLARALDEHAEKPALVMVHHNPAPGKAEQRSGLLDTDELMEILLPRPHVKMLIYGHSHHWEQKTRDGLHLINLPAVAYPFKVEEPTGWVDTYLARSGATIELRATDAAHPAHGKKIELKWRA